MVCIDIARGLPINPVQVNLSSPEAETITNPASASTATLLANSQNALLPPPLHPPSLAQRPPNRAGSRLHAPTAPHAPSPGYDAQQLHRDAGRVCGHVPVLVLCVRRDPGREHAEARRGRDAEYVKSAICVIGVWVLVDGECVGFLSSNRGTVQSGCMFLFSPICCAM